MNMSVDLVELAAKLAAVVQETETQAEAIADAGCEIDLAELSGAGPVVALMLEAEAAARESVDQAGAAFDLFVDTFNLDVER